MYKPGLKSSIFTTFLGLMLLSMVLIDVVISVLVYQNGVRNEIRHAKAVASYFIDNLNGAEGEVGPEGIDKKTLNAVKVSIGDKCLQVSYWNDGRIVSAVEDNHKWRMSELLRKYHTIDGEKTIKIAAAPSLFNLSPKMTFYVTPMNSESHGKAVLGILLDTGKIFKGMFQKQGIVILYILLNGIIFTTIGFFRLRKVILEPVEELVMVAENYQIADGSLFPSQSENEFGHLSRSMNSMLKKIEEDRQRLRETIDSLSTANTRLEVAQNEVIRAEKLAAAGRLSAGLAHEIGNPVTIVQGYLELLEDRAVSWPDRKEYVQRSLQELERVDGLLQGLLGATKKHSAKVDHVKVHDILVNVAKMIHPACKKKEITISYIPTDDFCVLGDEQSIHQVFLNLLMNAIDAIENTDGSGKVEIALRVQQEEKSERRYASVEISDNGIGISEENLKYLFEPFFTTKPPGEGTGLGLAVSYRLVKALGGRIEVESEQGKGSCFRVMMPISEANTNEAG